MMNLSLTIYVSQALLNPLPDRTLTFGFPRPSLHHPILARIPLGQFSQFPTLYIWSLWYLIGFLNLHHPSGDVMSDHPWLPSARILLGRVSQNPPHPWYFLLIIFHPLTVPPTSLLGYKLHFSLWYSKSSPVLRWGLSSPMAIVPE